MAFKKTQGRSAFVSPVGGPDLSGFKKAASIYEGVANQAYNIGLDVRKSQFNDAILQAEIDGKTAGVKYSVDKDGNRTLVPLTNLDYGKESELFSSRDRDAVLRQYRKSAITSYVANATIDIESAANQALIANPANPDGIRGSASGYFAGISDLDDEVYTALGPKVDAAFKIAENKALAQQQQNTRADQSNSAISLIDLNTEKLGVLYSKGAGDTDESQVGHELMVSELIEEQEEAFNVLKTNGVLDSDIQKLRDKQSTVIASRVGQAHIERIFTAEGEAGALRAIGGIVKDAQTNSSVDSDTLSTVLFRTASQLENIRRAEKSQETFNRNAIYQQIIKDIYINGLNVDDMLSNPKHMIWNLEGGQLASAISQSEARVKQSINDIYSGSSAVVGAWSSLVGTPDEYLVTDNYFDIKQQFVDGEIGYDKWLPVRDSYLSYIDNIAHQKDRDIAGQSVLKELGNNSSFTATPNYFEGITPNLVKSGVIGKNGAFKTIKAYQDSISSYTTKYNKNLSEMGTLARAKGHAGLGIPLTSAEEEALVKYEGSNIAILNDGTVVNMDLTSSDPELLAASIDTVDRYSGVTNGLLHPEAKRIFAQAPYNPDAADLSMRMLGQIVSGMEKQYGGSYKAHLSDFFDKNGISDEQRAYFKLIGDIGSVELAREVFQAGKKVDLNRDLSSYIGQRKDGETIDVAVDREFDEVFAEATTGHDWWSMFNPKISEFRQKQLEELAGPYGVPDIAGATIKDPVVRKSMKDLYYSRLIESRGVGDKTEIMRDVMITMGKRFGYEQNPDTGKINLVERPILTYAQATVPVTKFGSDTKPNIQLSQENIDNDVVNKALATSQFMSPEMAEGLRQVGNKGNGYESHLHYRANDNYGGPQTYTVTMVDHYGRPFVISDSYSYDFNHSSQNESYQKAVNALKTDKMKQIWSMMGLMDRNILQSSFESFERTKNDRSLTPIINGIQDIIYNTSPTAPPEFIQQFGEPLTDDERAEFFYMIENFFSLGWR